MSIKNKKQFFRLPVIAIFAGLALSFSALAGDIDQLHFIGFSPDGKYLAFETFGIQDGSGRPYALLTLVDVAKNDLSGKPISSVGEPMGTKVTEKDWPALIDRARKKTLGVSSGRLKALSFDMGHPPTAQVFHPLSDTLADPLKVQFASSVISTTPGPEFELTLKESPSDQPPCGPESLKPKAMELSLTKIATKQVRVLQKDKALPKSRSCATGYRIEAVYVYQRSIAVFVDVFSPGFEGDNRSFIVVTGSLDP